jgi:hypothetical protein
MPSPETRSTNFASPFSALAPFPRAIGLGHRQYGELPMADFPSLGVRYLGQAKPRQEVTAVRKPVFHLRSPLETSNQGKPGARPRD